MRVLKVARRRARSFVCAVGLLAGLAVPVGPASAEVIHKFQFDIAGTPRGTFEGDLATTAVDQASGDVYVVEYQHDLVDRFDASGKYIGDITGSAVPQGSFGFFISVSGVAVDNSGSLNNGDLYVAGSENHVVYRFDPTGKLLGEVNGSASPAGWFKPAGLAVDGSGNLYVADRAHHAVDEFNSLGGYVGQISSAQISFPETIAIDSAGNVYLANNGGGGGYVVKFEPGGGSSVLDANQATSVAVDPATSDVYVSENHYPGPGAIVEFNQAGSRLGAFGEEQLSSSIVGMAVHGASGDVYAVDENNKLVDAFGPGVVVPDVVTAAASSPQPIGATLNGTVNPDGEAVTGCQFEYGTSSSYGQTIACEQSPASLGAGTTAVPVSVGVAGLQPDTTYHFRLSASNANGANHGADLTFTTTGPPRIDGQSVSGVTHTKATLEAKIDPFGFDTTYHFEYGTSASYGTTVPVPVADIGSGMSDAAVAQTVSGLEAGVTYHFRVVASNSQGTVGGSDQTFTTVPPASLDGEWASNVAATSATFVAEVNPLGTSTAYRLEYGPTSSYGTTVSGMVGEGESDVLVSLHRQDLQRHTIYHYRFVLTNALGSVSGEDRALTTQAAGGELSLPDERAWELVSPPNKSGALIEPRAAGQTMMQASQDGGALTYLALGPIGSGVEGSVSIAQILSRRDSGEWSSRDIISRHEKPAVLAARGGFGYIFEDRFFSADLSRALVEPTAVEGQALLSPEATEPTFYLRDNTIGAFTPFLTATNVASGTRFGLDLERRAEFVDATPDLSHVILRSPEALAPSAKERPRNSKSVAGALENLFEWSGGTLQLVNVLPDGEASEADAYLGRKGELITHAVSADGRRIVWELRQGQTRLLYMRDMVSGVTIELGGPEALFQTASADGSRIFFTELPASRGLYDFTGDLMVYDANTGTTTDLSIPLNSGEKPDVASGLMGASEGGGYIYFVATGVLASGGRSGEDNLYVAHDTHTGWQITFVAALSGEDERSWVSQSFGSWTLSQVSSRVSPNGRYVAFMSQRSLTGYDNTDAASGKPDEEVFLYDAVTSRLTCVSCGPTGARPVGVYDGFESSEETGLLVDRVLAWASAHGTGNHWLAGSIPGWTTAINGEGQGFHQPRYLSDEGRVFFNSPVDLVPQDTNGLEDVYEYEPAGVGSCTPATPTFVESENGCVDLVSAGTSSEESDFYDASASGNDAFFITSSKLVSSDYDSSYDVYDAHVCSSSSPCIKVPVSPPECVTADSCKPAPSLQSSIFGSPASSTFAGQGNVRTTASKPALARRHKVKHRRHRKKRKRVKGRAGTSDASRNGGKRVKGSTSRSGSSPSNGGSKRS